MIALWHESNVFVQEKKISVKTLGGMSGYKSKTMCATRPSVRPINSPLGAMKYVSLELQRIKTLTCRRISIK